MTPDSGDRRRIAATSMKATPSTVWHSTSSVTGMRCGAS